MIPPCLWASDRTSHECFIRKNSLIQIASLLKAKLAQKASIVEEIKSQLNAWVNQLADNEITSLAYQINSQLNELEIKIAEFIILYRQVLD